MPQSTQTYEKKFDNLVLQRFMDRIADLQLAVTLLVSDGVNERILYFVKGGVRIISIGPRRGTDLATLMLEQGRIDVETLHSILEDERSGKRSVKAALTETNILEKDEYDSFVRKLIRDEILELAFWKNAYYEWFEDKPPGAVFDQRRSALVGSVKCEQLAEDVRHWCHKWKEVSVDLLSDQATIYLTHEGAEAGRSAEKGSPERFALKHCRKKPLLREVWRQTGIDLPELCDRLVEFKKKGWIKVHRSKTTEADPRETIDVLENNLDRVISKEIVYQRLATLYEKVGEPAKSADAYEVLARAALERDETKYARKLLRRLLVIAPERRDAFEKITNIYWNEGQLERAKAFATEHVQHLLKCDKTDEVRNVLRVLRGFPDAELTAEELSGTLLYHRKHLKQAAEKFVDCAAGYAEKGEFERAAAVIRKAISCDRENVSLLDKLDRYLAAAERSPGAKTVKIANTVKKSVEKEAAKPKSASEKAPSKAPSARPATAMVVLLLLAVVVLVAERFRLIDEAMDWLATLKTVHAEEGTKSSKDEKNVKKAAPTITLGGDGTQIVVNDNGGSTAASAGVAPGGGSAAIGLDGPGGAGSTSVSQESSGSMSTDTGLHESSAAMPNGWPAGNDVLGGKPSTTVEVNSPGTEPPAAPTAPATSSTPTETRTETASVGTGAPKTDRCPHNGAHPLRRRALTDRYHVIYGESCGLVLRDRVNNATQLTVDGQPGRRWAFGMHGTVIGAWSPGQTVVLHFVHERQRVESKWTLPLETKAFGVGERCVAVLENGWTSVLLHDGTSIGRGQFGAWDEGFINNDSLILVRQDHRPTAPRRLAVVDLRTMRWLWECIESDGRWWVR